MALDDFEIRKLLLNLHLGLPTLLVNFKSELLMEATIANNNCKNFSTNCPTPKKKCPIGD